MLWIGFLTAVSAFMILNSAGSVRNKLLQLVVLAGIAGVFVWLRWK
jgi:hypothetical protein